MKRSKALSLLIMVVIMTIIFAVPSHAAKSNPYNENIKTEIENKITDMYKTNLEIRQAMQALNKSKIDAYELDYVGTLTLGNLALNVSTYKDTKALDAKGVYKDEFIKLGKDMDETIGYCIKNLPKKFEKTNKGTKKALKKMRKDFGKIRVTK